MLDLANLQQKMAASIRQGEKGSDDLLALIKQKHIAPDRRLQIHRNNYRESLSDLIVSQFPLLEAFVGAAFLKATGAQYAKECPPAEAALSQFSKGFPDFLKQFKPAAKLGYLPDLARLEWAVSDVHNRMPEAYIEEPAMLASALQAGQVRLVRQAQLIKSDYAILSLWMVGQKQLPPEAVHLDADGQAAIVAQIDGAVQILPLTQAMLDFLEKSINKKIGENGRHDTVSSRETKAQPERLYDQKIIEQAINEVLEQDMFQSLMKWPVFALQ